jgi:MFS family permease
LFTAAFVALALSDLAYFLASGLLIGVTPFFVTGPLGSDALGVGLVLGAFSVTALVLRPVVGRLADRLGRRPLLLAGALGFAVMVAAHLAVHRLWLLVVVRVLLGVAEALYFVAGFAVLADLAPAGRAGEALSWNSVAVYAGIAVGPSVGQFLMSWHGFTAAWVGGALLALLAAVLILRIPETGRSASEGSDPVALIHRGVLRPGLALCAGVGAAAGFLALVGLRAVEIGLSVWSAVPMVYGGVVVGCRLAFARLLDRLPPLRLAGASLAACTIGLVILAGAPGVPGLFGGAAVLAVGVSFLTPAIFSAVFAAVPAHERGAVAGTATVFIDLGLGGGPLLLGFVATSGGIPLAFVCAAALTGAAIPLILGRGSQPALRGPSSNG